MGFFKSFPGGDTISEKKMMTTDQPSDVAIKVLFRQFQLLGSSLIVVMSLTAASLQVLAQNPVPATRRGAKATSYAQVGTATSRASSAP